MPNSTTSAPTPSENSDFGQEWNAHYGMEQRRRQVYFQHHGRLLEVQLHAWLLVHWFCPHHECIHAARHLHHGLQGHKRWCFLHSSLCQRKEGISAHGQRSSQTLPHFTLSETPQVEHHGHSNS